MEDSGEHWELPVELWKHIFQYLSNKDACSCALVCFEWKTIFEQFPPDCWKKFRISFEMNNADEEIVMLVRTEFEQNIRKN